MHKRTESNSTEVTAPFKLVLPTELNIAPTFSVDISPNRRIEVYTIERDVENYRRAVTPVSIGKMTVYVTREVNAKTGAPLHDRYGSETEFSELVALKFHVEERAKALLPKKKTRVVETDGDDENE